MFHQNLFHVVVKILSSPLMLCILQFHHLHWSSNEKPTYIVLPFSQVEDQLRSKCGYEEGICIHPPWQTPIISTMGWLLLPSKFEALQVDLLFQSNLQMKVYLQHINQ
jgi:hypothetical protein